MKNRGMFIIEFFSFWDIFIYLYFMDRVGVGIGCLFFLLLLLNVLIIIMLLERVVIGE